jgi:hypothetical protein
MPATNAYPNGALPPKDKKMPETRADTDSTKISGPKAAGEERTRRRLLAPAQVGPLTSATVGPRLG